MSKQIDKTTLGYLGDEYQKLLVKAFIEDPTFFESLVSIVDQNMFTSPYLKRMVGFMKDHYDKHQVVLTYKDLNLLFRTKVSNATDVKILTELCS